MAEGTENRGGMAAASRMHRATTKDLPSLIMGGGLEMQPDGNVRGALRLIHIYLKEHIFDRYLTKEGR